MIRRRSKAEPEKGEAWLLAVAAFLLYFMSWGIATGFGAFQEFYQTDLLREYSPSAISWIGSVQTFFLVTTGVITGPFYDQGYLRLLVFIGSLLMILGFMLLSLCTEYYQVFLCEGVIFGIGSGIAYVPAISAVSARFTKNRAVAMGFTTAGGSIGGIVFPILIRRLQPSIGFGWTARVIGFIELATAIVANIIIYGEGHQKRPPRNSFSQKLLPNRHSNRVGLSADLSFYTLSIVNAASTFGRIVPAFAVNKIGAMPLLAFSTVASIALIFGWIGATSPAGFIVFCVLWGFVSGILPSLVPVGLSLKPLTPDMSVIGSRMGMCWLCSGIGVLIGTPIAGALVDVGSASFLKAQIFAGAMMTGGLISLVWPWVAVERAKKQVL